ncbi:hypothetical protein VNO78_34958 [Psophocarpus tetragonolobus]|uniref:Uncharacterized protein n=1 Tax=Psophocarpus tetragonolobus TaxID=3891 RepID=A0AAN9NNH9_PSOTE
MQNKDHSSRPPAAASPAGTGEPPGGPDPATPHDRRLRLERTPRSRRASPPGHPDRGGDRASHAQIAAEIASRTPRSQRRSRLARPDRGGDRVSRAQIAAEIAFRSTAQIPADLGAFGSFSATCSSSSPSPSSGSTAALRIVPDPVGSWHFGASRAACSTAVPRGLPLAKIPSALVRRRSRREGGNTAGAGSTQEPFPFSKRKTVSLSLR